MNLLMADRYDPDGRLEAEPVQVQVDPVAGVIFRHDDGTEFVYSLPELRAALDDVERKAA